MKVRRLFKNIGWEAAVEELKSVHIIAKVYENHVVLNYNQIFSPETDRYVMECRGLILDKTGDIACRRWKRFFNYGQQSDITGKFEFEGSEILEKVDGSTIAIWYNKYDNKWEISTRGTAFAESEQLWYPTFRQAVLEDGFGITEDRFQKYFMSMPTEWTYVFEYCSIKNRIVTLYEEPTMFLVSTISNDTGYENDYRDNSFGVSKFQALSANIKHIKKYDFDSMSDMVAHAKGLTNLDEGFVARDTNGLRIKIKSEFYVRVHSIRGNGSITPKKILSLVCENEHEEFLSYFSEYKEMFQPYIVEFGNLMVIIGNIWNNTRSIVYQKEFAMAIKNYPYSGILFSMRKTEKSFDEIWTETRLDSKVKLLAQYMNIEVNNE